MQLLFGLLLEIRKSTLLGSFLILCNCISWYSLFGMLSVVWVHVAMSNRLWSLKIYRVPLYFLEVMVSINHNKAYSFSSISKHNFVSNMLCYLHRFMYKNSFPSAFVGMDCFTYKNNQSYLLVGCARKEVNEWEVILLIFSPTIIQGHVLLDWSSHQHFLLPNLFLRYDSILWNPVSLLQW